MSDAIYYTLVTDIGRAQFANLQLLQQPMKLKYMAVGDGRGSQVLPKGSETQLAHEVYRGQINRLVKDPDDPTQLIAELVITAQTGGFEIREGGIFDEDGNLIYYGSLPMVIKPTLPDGTGMDYVLTMRVLISNDVDVELKIDPGVVIATREYVDDSIAEHNADEDAHEAAFAQHDADPDAHEAAINKHNSNAEAHAALMAAHNADENANSAAIAKHNADPNAHSSNDLSWINCGACTRVSDDQISVTGDQSAKFPKGKLLRMNEDDTYICRVLGDPVVNGGVTTIQVWFDYKTTVPASITKLERYPLIPQATARGIMLLTTTQYDDTMKQKLIDSYCYSSVRIKGA